jgi:hypothetical protein
MKRTCLAAIAIVLWVQASWLVAPSSSDARPFGAYENGLYRLAIDYWGGTKPRGCTRVVRQVATPPNILSSGEAVPPYGRPEACILKIAAEAVLDPYAACLVLVH